MKAKKNKIIALNGSPNKSGSTASLLKKLDVKIIHIIDGIEKAKEAVLAADVVVFATPVRWFNVSVPMKELIEALPESPDFPCEGKTAYFLAVCDEDGAQQAISLMFNPVNHMGFRVPPYACYIYNKNMAKKSEDEWQFKGISELHDRLTAYKTKIT